MWPLYPLSDVIIGITITSNYTSCSWVEQQDSHFYLKAYTKQPHQEYEIMNSVIYNSSKIKKTLQQFLHTYNIHNAYAVLAIEHALPDMRIIMQYQLLSINIPLNCIMIISHDTINQMHYSYTLSNSCDITKDEALYNIGLYILGKNCERAA